MAGRNERFDGPDEHENLQDSFILSMIIGLIIVAIWIWVFLEYLSRL